MWSGTPCIARDCTGCRGLALAMVTFSSLVDDFDVLRCRRHALES